MGLLCLIIPALSSFQEAAKSAKKPELIELQLKVADKKDGSPIDDADVKVMWGQGHESGSGEGITNASGIARIKNVPRGAVVIRVIANGYKTVAPSVDLNRGEQPVNIQMEKEAKSKDKDQEPPPANLAGSRMFALLKQRNFSFPKR
jgi:hypothetical protein